MMNERSVVAVRWSTNLLPGTAQAPVHAISTQAFIILIPIMESDHAR